LAVFKRLFAKEAVMLHTDEAFPLQYATSEEHSQHNHLEREWASWHQYAGPLRFERLGRKDFRKRQPPLFKTSSPDL
jgi:hypothetical protein